MLVCNCMCIYIVIHDNDDDEDDNGDDGHLVIQTLRYNFLSQ